MPTTKGIIESDIGHFFDFTKTAGIISIFCYHFYNRFLGGLSKDVVESGFLHNLFSGIRTFEQLICFIFQVFFAFGYMGVELFIIASGFGLYYSYLTKRQTWPVFYKKRAIRVLPLYYFFLFLVFALTIFTTPQTFYTSPEGIKVLVYHILLLQTFNKSYVYYGLFYFVAIIFQLYILFPALIKVFRKSWAPLITFAVFLLSSTITYRIFALLDIHFSGILITDFLPFFFLGMVIAHSKYKEDNFHIILLDKRISFLFFILLAIIVSYCIGNEFFNQEMRRTTALLIFLSLPFVYNFVKQLRAKKIITFVAYTSYPFYLMHMIFINRLSILSAWLGLINSYQSWISVGIVSFVCTLSVSYGIQRGYDRITKTIGNLSKSTVPR